MISLDEKKSLVINFFIFATSLLKNVLILWGENLYQSLLGVKVLRKPSLQQKTDIEPQKLIFTIKFIVILSSKESFFFSSERDDYQNPIN